MTESEYTKAVINRAIEQIEEAEHMVAADIDQALTELQSDMNALRLSNERVQRLILTAISKHRSAKAEADSVVMGATGMVADSILLILQNDDELVRMVQGLYAMKQELDKTQNEILGPITSNNSKMAGRLQTAISHLRSYWSVL